MTEIDHAKRMASLCFVSVDDLDIMCYVDQSTWSQQVPRFVYHIVQWDSTMRISQHARDVTNNDPNFAPNGTRNERFCWQGIHWKVAANEQVSGTSVVWQQCYRENTVTGSKGCPLQLQKADRYCHSAKLTLSRWKHSIWNKLGWLHILMSCNNEKVVVEKAVADNEKC